MSFPYRLNFQPPTQRSVDGKHHFVRRATDLLTDTLAPYRLDAIDFDLAVTDQTRLAATRYRDAIEAVARGVTRDGTDGYRRVIFIE